MDSKKAQKQRGQLRHLLEKILIDVELAEPTSHLVNLGQLLTTTLTALEDLDQGETPPLFKPRPSKRRARRPAETRRLQIFALRHEAALRRLGTPLITARTQIAADYKVSFDTIRSWAKKLKAEAKSELANALRDDLAVYRSSLKMKWPVPSVDQIRNAARLRGDALRALRPPKQPIKKGKKSPP